MTISDRLLGKLSDPGLLQAAGYLNGAWIAKSDSGKTFDVTNPANGDTLATLPDMGAAETARAIDAAHAAQKQWAAKTAKERSAMLRKLNDLMIAHVDDLAIILTSEMGKPVGEAGGEVRYGASYLEWFAEEAKRIDGDVLPGQQADKRVVVLKQPVGVVGMITPWNFPNAMLARKMAPALAVGCAVVSKPAAQTPLSAIAIAVLCERVGLPAGLFNLIVGTSGSEVGKEMCANPKLRKLSFTGSTEVGRILMRQGADQILKLSLELGGNAPFIVFDDADLDAAAKGAILSKYRNAGQTCVCANRIYVQDGVYDAFAEKFAAEAAALKGGDGFQDGVDMGPLIDEAGLAKVEDHVADALSKGAELVTGGSRSNAGALFYEPTVLRNVTREMKVAREETFGPVAPLFRFDTVEDVIEQANATEFGLAAYFYARDLSRVWRVAEALEYGMVGVNTGIISNEGAPFGGVKQSGLGREGSKYGADDYLEMKYVCMGGV
ncbi:MAG: NAD-dependent succinate-semialdehyde dehydrogenase [Roseitalea sp.]|jgi:succinate-semialdehyde dehydrogenase/glutarate-semialdehyde dehydrogenase|nr:NAD-dependent succinate-semialdehyde dehydrogenase [Roseitalea sp.]MBO6720244.1 NAD-dependent succinate-semialdehyde dehydrogenase [Roseitalea sp.]MBO6742604.1 NAD-dependent succinate-semialdehyde dehydrogenase [Roseitalea sp.]